MGERDEDWGVYCRNEDGRAAICGLWRMREDGGTLILGQTLAAAAGRSGLLLRCFAMRLMHMDKPVSVVGEIVTPAIGATIALVTANAAVMFRRHATLEGSSKNYLFPKLET